MPGEAGTAEPRRRSPVGTALTAITLAILTWLAVTSASFEGWKLGVLVFAAVVAVTIGIVKRTFRPSPSAALKPPWSRRWASGLTAGSLAALVTMSPVWYWQQRHDDDLRRATATLCAVPPPSGLRVVECGGEVGSYQTSSEGFGLELLKGDCIFEAWIRLQGPRRADSGEIGRVYDAEVIERHRVPGTPGLEFSGWTSSGRVSQGAYETAAYFGGSLPSGLDLRC